LRKEYGGTEIGEKIAVGRPGEGYGGFEKETGSVTSVQYPPGKFKVSGKKAEEVMGFKYITFPQSVIDTARALEPLL